MAGIVLIQHLLTRVFVAMTRFRFAKASLS